MAGFPGQMALMVALVISVKRVLKTLLDCSFLCENFSLLWSNLQQKILNLDAADGPRTVLFSNNLDHANKALFLLGGLLLPFHKQMYTMIRKICQRMCL